MEVNATGTMRKIQGRVSFSFRCEAKLLRASLLGYMCATCSITQLGLTEMVANQNLRQLHGRSRARRGSYEKC